LTDSQFQVFKKRKYPLGNKVILGFILAGLLVLGVSIVTFVSIRKLLFTVESITEPNERLSQLNGLLADIYLLDVTKTERTSDRDSLLEQTLSSAKSRLDWLKNHARDSVEYKTFDQVGLNIAEIMVVYAGLEEVRYILTNRIFSEEALKNIELRTKRQQELNELEFLSRIKTRQNRENPGSRSFGNEDPLSDFSARNELDVQEELMEIVREIQSGNSASTNPKASSDSAIQSIRAVVEEIYKDEKRQQSNFIALESRLIEKNKEIYAQIQGAISKLQVDLLAEYNDQNQSAYRLTYTVSIVLGFLVFLGVVGSLGFIFSILKEVNQANTYREKLEEAKKKSDQLAKAKQDFLANMSHEIRNPLHAIQGYQRALNQSGLNAQQREFVEMIGFASRTLISIVNDILDFSKLEAGQVNIENAPFEPFKLFLSLKSFYDFKAEEKKLDFEWDIDLPRNKWLLGDQLRLNQILNNLLSNSFKFTSQGSVRVHIGFEDEKLALEVVDTGMGMGPEVKENLFKEFNQGDASITRKFGGTGLGLAIIRKLIDHLGGNVEVWSEVGVGTKVKVKLPFKVVDPVDQRDAQELSYDLTGLNVLVVDDDPVGLKLMKLLLESAGAKVMDFVGGLAWRENFKNLPLDLAILDIQMPEVSGLNVLKALKSNRKYRNLPVLAMTANVFANEENTLAKQGFDGVVLKPFDDKLLFQEIDRHLGINKKPAISKKTPAAVPSDVSRLFDTADIRRFCMGDEQLVQEIILDLIQKTTEDLNKLRSALPMGDYSKIREICHQLASRLAQIKVPFSVEIREIETGIVTGRIQGLDLKLEKAIHKLEALLGNLTLEYSEKVEPQP
jgi:signal transduction histidine kinase/FixJ family two-component response regulator